MVGSVFVEGTKQCLFVGHPLEEIKFHVNLLEETQGDERYDSPQDPQSRASLPTLAQFPPSEKRAKSKG